MPTWRPEVQGVRGGQGVEVHRGGRVIPREDTTPDPLPGLRGGSHYGVYDGTPPLHSREVTVNRLEPVAGQSDGAPPAGIRCEISTFEKAVPLPLPRLPGVLSHVKCLALALQ